MTQLGEPVAIGMIVTFDDECPFDHDNPEPPTVENQLIGEGGKLGTRMKNGTSTHLYAPYKAPCESILNPRDRAEHPFYKKARVVRIRTLNPVTEQTYEHTYPVTAAAHHLIPAQESLKHSGLLAFMVKKGETASLKGKSFSSGAVWANVGYEVNGSENGIYLPGSYAVGGGRGGLGLWTGNDDVPDKEEEDPANAANPANPEDPEDTADPASAQLSGALNQISDDNRKWCYVRQAMALGPGQFHDRHEEYSRFVLEALDKIAEDYQKQYERSFVAGECGKCKERADKLKELGIPTPFGLAARLNRLSANLGIFLNGSTWRPNIYTSKWGDAFMKALKNKHPAARISTDA